MHRIHAKLNALDTALAAVRAAGVTPEEVQAYAEAIECEVFSAEDQGTAVDIATDMEKQALRGPTEYICGYFDDVREMVMLRAHGNELTTNIYG